MSTTPMLSSSVLGLAALVGGLVYINPLGTYLPENFAPGITAALAASVGQRVLSPPPLTSNGTGAEWPILSFVGAESGAFIGVNPAITSVVTILLGYKLISKN